MKKNKYHVDLFIMYICIMCSGSIMIIFYMYLFIINPLLGWEGGIEPDASGLQRYATATADTDQHWATADRHTGALQRTERCSGNVLTASRRLRVVGF